MMNLKKTYNLKLNIKVTVKMEKKTSFKLSSYIFNLTLSFPTEI